MCFIKHLGTTTVQDYAEAFNVTSCKFHQKFKLKIEIDTSVKLKKLWHNTSETFHQSNRLRKQSKVFRVGQINGEASRLTIFLGNKRSKSIIWCHRDNCPLRHQNWRLYVDCARCMSCKILILVIDIWRHCVEVGGGTRETCDVVKSSSCYCFPMILKDHVNNFSNIQKTFSNTRTCQSLNCPLSVVNG